ncbi:MAG TPA: DedA family protein [Longimicrobiales bacterium]|nr:DedA family protein [Longimicrobiales bacterium]
METIQGILGWLTGLPALLIYVVLGIGAALENIIPPIPADTFVLAGAVLAARGAADPWLVYLVTWIPNVVSAVGVYYVARRYGRGFFRLPVARWLLREHQLQQMAAFYQDWGVPAIFVSRFLPAWRALVPVFAGVSGMSAWRVIPPVVIASGLWYGLVVYLGAFAGRNLEAIIGVFENLSSVLLWAAVAAFLVAGIWWWRSRHHHHDEEEPRSGRRQDGG